MSVFDNYQCDGQLSIEDVFAPDLWCGRTCQEPLAQTREKISDASLKKFAELRIKPPQYLCLKKEDGVQADVSWETGGALLGEYTICSFGDAPSVVKESRLSQILEVNAPEKYFLSAKACQGILRRAARRGKALPETLKIVLEKQAVTPLKSGGGREFDRYGKRAGKGALVQEELSGTLGVSQDQTLITGVTYRGDSITNPTNASNPKQGDPCHTLTDDSRNYVVLENHPQDSRMKIKEDGIFQTMGARQGAETDPHTLMVVETYGLDRASFNQGKNAQYDFSVEKELAQPLVARGPGGVLTKQ